MKTLALLALLVSSSALAVVVNGVKVPDTMNVDGKSLVLNGTGMREATFLKVKVYVGALYLEKKSSDPAQILASESPKSVQLHFVRDVGAEKLRDAWKESVEKNCKPDCAAAEAGVAKLNAAMKDMKEGETIGVNFLKDKVEVSVTGGKPQMIEGAAFGHALLKVWLGEDPPNGSLKEGMLGRK